MNDATQEQRTVQSLATLVSMRERAVDRLQADLAEKQRVAERFRYNLDRMAQLCAGQDAPGRLPIALSLNFATYKEALLQIAETHRTDLALHEADMAATQRALLAAARQREALGQVLGSAQRRIADAAASRERKNEDELAARLWARKKVP